MAKVFISYRRNDAKWAAGRIRDAIDARFGQGACFLDTADLVAGQDWKKTITEEVRAAKIVVAVIGQNWAGTSVLKRTDVVDTAFIFSPIAGLAARGVAWVMDKDDPIKTHRLQSDDDMVRFELTQAFAAKKPILPCLCDGAELPSANVLLAPLDGLPALQHLKLSYEQFEAALPALYKAIERHLR